MSLLKSKNKTVGGVCVENLFMSKSQKWDITSVIPPFSKKMNNCEIVAHMCNESRPLVDGNGSI